MSLKLQIRSLKIYLLWNDCRPLAKVYGKKESFILYVSNHVFDLGHLYSSNCGLNALHKIISLLKGKKIFHKIIQFWDICEKNMENEQWQINRKKDNCKHIYIYLYHTNFNIPTKKEEEKLSWPLRSNSWKCNYSNTAWCFINIVCTISEFLLFWNQLAQALAIYSDVNTKVHI